MNVMHLVSALLIALALFSLHVAAQDDPPICAGCPVPADPKDSNIQKYAEDAVAEIQKQANCACTYHLESIVNVTTQVVAGELIHYDLLLRAVTMAGDVVSIGLEACSVDVWIKEWEDIEQVTINSCNRITQEQR